MLLARHEVALHRQGVRHLTVLLAVFLVASAAVAQDCDEPGVASYAAVQDGEEVYVFACGVHRTGGYKNCLTVGPEDIFPPIFDFKIKRPTGPVIQLISPFAVKAQFSSQQKIGHVQVRDASGTHRVSVVSLARGKDAGTSTVGSSAPAARRRRELKSSYQDSPVDFGIGNFRGIRVAGVISNGKKVDVSLDPNLCGLNEFGDRTTCTLMAPTNFKAKLVRQRLADPLGADRSIFRLESNKLPKSLIVYLVAHPREDCWRIVLERPGPDGPPARVVVALQECPGVTTVKHNSKEGLCETVGKDEVGEPGLIALLQHTVDLSRESVMVIRNNETSLCPSHAAIAILVINGKVSSHGDISDVKSLIQANAKPGDKVTAIVKAMPLDNDIRCVRLGTVSFSLEQCELE